MNHIIIQNMLKKYLNGIFLNRSKKGVVKNMKKRLAAIVSAIALMITGAASMGCMLFFIEEPKALDTFRD